MYSSRTKNQSTKSLASNRQRQPSSRVNTASEAPSFAEYHRMRSQRLTNERDARRTALYEEQRARRIAREEERRQIREAKLRHRLAIDTLELKKVVI